MAIQEITSTELVQRCAKCDRENRIVLADLEVGVERDDQARSDAEHGTRALASRRAGILARQHDPTGHEVVSEWEGLVAK